MINFFSDIVLMGVGTLSSTHFLTDRRGQCYQNGLYIEIHKASSISQRTFEHLEKIYGKQNVDYVRNHPRAAYIRGQTVGIAKKIASLGFIILIYQLMPHIAAFEGIKIGLAAQSKVASLFFQSMNLLIASKPLRVLSRCAVIDLVPLVTKVIHLCFEAASCATRSSNSRIERLRYLSLRLAEISEGLWWLRISSLVSIEVIQRRILFKEVAYAVVGRFLPINHTYSTNPVGNLELRAVLSRFFALLGSLSAFGSLLSVEKHDIETLDTLYKILDEETIDESKFENNLATALKQGKIGKKDSIILQEEKNKLI
ncbi:MAG: hypothetical protein Tsb0021_05700 [Chlamydiales bacterium]